MSLDYRIGTTVGNMVTLASLGIDDPQPVPVQYAEHVPVGDGSLAGLGWLQCEWSFDWIHKNDVTTLRAYCPEPAVSASVYIKTVKSGGGMQVYSGTLWWPRTEPPLQGDYFEDFTLVFVKLVAAGT